jgi:asparagine N-glycosylation enzyme membrane subunit Stt3
VFPAFTWRTSSEDLSTDGWLLLLPTLLLLLLLLLMAAVGAEVLDAAAFLLRGLGATWRIVA